MPRYVGLSSFDILHPLVKSKSLEVKCDETLRNLARLERHKGIKHVHICDICKEWDNETEYRGDAAFSRHTNLVHTHCDKPLTDEDYALSVYEDCEGIRSGPETPRRIDLKSRSQEEKMLREEERRREMEEERRKNKEEVRRKKGEEEVIQKS